jgi:hypothetical protein
LALGITGVFVPLSAFVVAVSTRHLLTSEAFAQPPAQASHEPGLHLGHEPGQPFEPLLDGSVQPEDVPDSVAIRVLMQTLRVPANADAAARNQLQVRAGRVGLGEADFEILVREVGVLDTRAKDQEARIEAVRTSLAGAAGGTTARFLEDQYREERKNLSALVADHYQQLLQSLSPEGVASLQAHLNHIKSRIKIYPTPDMSKQIL